MSVEMITMLVSTVSILLALAGSFGWVVHRMDVLHADVKGDVAQPRSELGARIDKVADELVEVKIAVARIEGTPRHLITRR